MPVCDGLEATRLIRSEESADPSRRRIPIVAVTANASKEVEVDCMKAGMEGCMCARLLAPSPGRSRALFRDFAWLVVWAVLCRQFRWCPARRRCR